jgi:methyl-accepting chemotaxis protein PixJ
MTNHNHSPANLIQVSSTENINNLGKSLSLKVKTTLFAIAIGVIPVATIGFFSYLILNRSLTQEMSQQQLEKTTIAGDSLGRFLEDRIREVETLSKDAILTNSKFRDTATIEEKTVVLTNFQDQLQYYDSIVFFDLKGNPLFQSKSEKPYQGNYSTQEYFQQAIKTQKITINGPGISSSSGKLRVEFAAPVKDSTTGKLLGVVRLRIPGTYINSIFTVYQEQSKHWYLVNTEGTIFAGDLEEQLNQPLATYFPEVAPLHQAKRSGVLKSQASQLVSSTNSKQKENYSKENINQKGERQIVSYVLAKPPARFPDLHIGTLLTLDEDIALASLKQLGLIVFSGTTIAAIIVAAIAAYLANRTTSPLVDAVLAVKKIGNGQLDTRLKVTGSDELGELNSNINLMAEQIQKSLQEQVNLTHQQGQAKEKLETAIYTLIEEIADAADGDLTVRANLNSLELSTVADLFNAIINNLQEIAIETRQSTSQVGDSLKQNEQAIRILAEQAIAEAEETRNTLISIEQMTQSIQAVAQNASQTEQIVDDTYDTILYSTQNMDSTVDSILKLRTTVRETAIKMQQLRDSSQKISQVVSLIEEIALKTNVLAINAGAEADRAGEYGQGFAIVAEQVGALAEQCTAATKEIAKIVTAIQAETKEVNQAMESGTTQVVETTQLVESTKESLSLVLEKSQAISLLMESISQSTVSQASTSQNVTNLMQKIARLSENTSQSSQKVAQSIVETAQIAAKLQSTVAQFKVAD